MSLPKHLAIIMDGNGRWAQLKKKPRVYGHIKGAKVAKKIITACADLGIGNLTLYAFSSENWHRPTSEVLFLMNLLRRYLKKETENLHKKNIRFTVIGDLSKLPIDVLQAIEYAKNRTGKNTGLNLTFAISYGSRQEIVEAAKKLAQKVLNNEFDVNEIDEATFSSYLSTHPTPDPDFIIRTSGEYRLSNFLMWQAAYSELYFCETLWPNFTEKDLNLALANFLTRERRFGTVISHENAHH